ncbi:MAG: endonuclease domain-containing protein [Bacteroidales bacterium]|nr:endonuclease domain-containing protein [Bacteroidales bacterium]
MNNTNDYKNLKKYARELRNNSTLGEIILWKKVLRAKKFHGYQFNRQFVIDNYIADFVCRKLKIVIEIDGYSHQFKHQKDIEKDKYLKDLGYRVLRFKESEVRHKLDDVVWQLEKFLEDDLQL